MFKFKLKVNQGSYTYYVPNTNFSNHNEFMIRII